MDDGHSASLQRGKVYPVLPPLPRDPKGSLRVIDDEGEDYLYPAGRFEPIELPPRARRALRVPVTA